jgi:DNA-binding LytR/AlgR family response regulator
MLESFRYISVDDEPVAHDVLRALLREHPDFVDAGRHLRPAQVLQLDATQPLDLVFVDYAMPGTDGLALLAQLPRSWTAVLLTAHADHALAAFDCGVRDYLLKPVSPERLAACLTRLRPLLRLQRTQGPTSPRVALAFPCGREQRYLAPGDIVAIDADANFSALCTLNGERHFISESLKSLEERLALFGFMRVHKGHLVNRVHILGSRSDSLSLRGDLSRPLGRIYRPQVLQQLSG